MNIQAFPLGPFSTNAYVASCKDTFVAAIIDPAADSFKEISRFLSETKIKPALLLLTHSHWDHIVDAKLFKERYKIPVYVHPLDALNLENPGSDGLPCWISIPSLSFDYPLKEGMEIAVGNLTFQVIHTPGHSPGSVCFFEPNQKVLFSGDTLFKGTIGNISFPTSQPSLMWPSLNKLALLPPETQVYPGHGPVTTIQEESSWLINAKNLFDF